tara:strand:+ start:129 stop:2780 length:2652 start_codon:yes stop_codon:yes gene_type:complete
MPKFVIEVRTKGFANAKAEIQKTAEQTRKFARDSGKGAGAAAAFRREASKLRNNMLLVSFAMAGAAATIGQFVTAAASIEKVKLRLEGLMGSTEGATEAFEAFNQIAKRTPQNIEELAGAGAQLEAFGIDSKAALTAVTDLANFMGRPVQLAAFAMGRAFSGGAAASEILKEAGITNIVALSQNIDDLTKLTLPEFRSALFNTLIDPAARIAGSSDRVADSLQGMISTLQDSVFNLRAEVGEKFLPSIKATVKALTSFTDSMDPSTLMRMVSSLAILTTGLRLQRAGWLGATAGATAFFSTVATGMKRFAVLFIIDTALKAFGDLIEANERRILGATDAQEDLADAVFDTKKAEAEYAASLEESAKQSGVVAVATEAMIEAQEDLRESIDKSIVGLVKRRNSLLDLTALDEYATNVYMNEERVLTSLEESLLKNIMALEKSNKTKKESADLDAKILNDNISTEESLQNLIDIRNKLNKVDILEEQTGQKVDLDYLNALQLDIDRNKERAELISNVSKELGLSAMQTAQLRSNLTDINEVQSVNNFQLGLSETATIALNSEQQNYIITQIEALKVQRDLNEEEARFARKLREAEEALAAEAKLLQAKLDIEQELVAVQSSLSVQQATNNQASDLEIVRMETRNAMLESLTESLGGTRDTYNMLNDVLPQNIANIDLETTRLTSSTLVTDELTDAIIELHQQKQKLAEVTLSNAEIDGNATGTLTTYKKQMDLFAQSILMAAGAIKTLGESSKTPKDDLKILLQTLGSIVMMVPGGQVPGALMQAGAMFVGHTGGLIKDNGIQKFATGGMVQGQDNVPIMAQAGEFIMQRSAVDNIGIQNLAAMNSGQTSSGVTVNIQGNMIGNDEFIRDNLIPQLNKAANQNLA